VVRYCHPAHLGDWIGELDIPEEAQLPGDGKALLYNAMSLRRPRVVTCGQDALCG